MSEDSAMTAITVEEYEEYHRLKNMYHTEYFDACAEINKLKEALKEAKEQICEDCEFHWGKCIQKCTEFLKYTKLIGGDGE